MASCRFIDNPSAQGSKVSRKICSSRGPGNEATCSVHSIYFADFLEHCVPSAIYSAVSAITIVVAWATNRLTCGFWDYRKLIYTTRSHVLTILSISTCMLGYREELVLWHSSVTVIIIIVLHQVMPLYTVSMVQHTSLIPLKIHENCGVAHVELNKLGKYFSTYIWYSTLPRLHTLGCSCQLRLCQEPVTERAVWSRDQPLAAFPLWVGSRD